MRKIGDFEIVDHGICYSVDCKSNNFSHVATGFGVDMAEAIRDCIVQMRMVDFNIEDIEVRILEQREWDLFPIEPCVDVWDDRRFKNHCVDFYHVSIRWNETHKLPIGGLMRCCIKTLEATTRRDIVNCRWCNTLMQVKNGAWEFLLP